MTSPLRLVGILGAGILLLAACTPSASVPPTESGGAPGGDELTGDIQVSGSSTVEPITSRVATAFGDLHPNVTYFVDGPGTGDGFALFCDGETDVSDASRPINEEEAATCDTNGIEYIELKIAIDGLSVITSVLNEDIACLSFLDLYALLGPEAEGLEDENGNKTWSAHNALAAELEAELGTEFGESHAPYTDDELQITAPGDESGTYDSFVELAIQKVADARDQERTTRLDYTPSAQDNVIIEGVAGTPDAFHTLGWVGYGFAAENSDRVKLLDIDKGDGCVAATPGTILSAEYPLSRFLFIYVNAVNAADEPALAAFVDYYLSDEGIAAVTAADYVALDPADLEETRATWESR